jgi:hypothetical protein
VSKSLTCGDLTSERPAGKHHLTPLTIPPRQSKTLPERRYFAILPSVTKRTKLLLTGFIPILAITLIVIGIFALGALPGFAGEFFRKISGIMFHPVFPRTILRVSRGSLRFFGSTKSDLRKRAMNMSPLEIDNDEIDPDIKK